LAKPLRIATYSPNLDESNEEAGILPEESAGLRLLGVYRQDTDKPTDVFFYRNQLGVDLEEIAERHGKALARYNELKEEGKAQNINPEVYARNRMAEIAQENPEFARDSWELKEGVMIVENDPDAIIAAVKPRLEIGKLRHGMFGALPIFFRHEYGAEAANKLLASYNFGEMVKFL